MLRLSSLADSYCTTCASANSAVASGRKDVHLLLVFELQMFTVEGDNDIIEAAFYIWSIEDHCLKNGIFLCLKFSATGSRQSAKNQVP